MAVTTSISPISLPSGTTRKEALLDRIEPRHGPKQDSAQSAEHATLATVLIVDDHPVMRDGIRFALQWCPDLQVVGEAGSGEEAVQLMPTVRPQIVLMDLLMPGMGGLAAIRALRHQAPDCKILVLTSVEQGVAVRDALQSGAHGYHLKDAGLDDLIRAIRSLVNDQPSLSPGAARLLVQPVARPPVLFEPLTAREREVLQLLAQGLPNKEIADKLVVTEATVKAHVRHIRGKLQATSRTHIVSLALQHDLLADA